MDKILGLFRLTEDRYQEKQEMTADKISKSNSTSNKRNPPSKVSSPLATVSLAKKFNRVAIKPKKKSHALQLPVVRKSDDTITVLAAERIGEDLIRRKAEGRKGLVKHESDLVQKLAAVADSTTLVVLHSTDNVITEIATARMGEALSVVKEMERASSLMRSSFLIN